MLKRCPICANTGIVHHEERLSVYRCPACSHIFAIPSDELRESYDEDYFIRTHKNWFDNPDRKLLEIAYKEISKAASGKNYRLLDAGCGKGAFLRFLANRDPGAKLSGIDLTSNQDPVINFIKGDIFKTDIDAKFDIISTLFVIEHIDDPQLFIRKLKSMLKPRGVIVIMTINSDGLIYKIARLLDRVGMHTAYERLYSLHNFQYYTPRSLEMLIGQNGLEVLSHKTNGQSLGSVDFPEKNPLVESIFISSLWCIFAVSSLLKKEIFQTIVCRMSDDTLPAGSRS